MTNETWHVYGPHQTGTVLTDATTAHVLQFLSQQEIKDDFTVKADYGVRVFSGVDFILRYEVKHVIPVTKAGNVQYFVSLNHDHGYFSQQGYSKYDERFRRSREGEPELEVYGYEQALDHIAELRENVYNGKKHYAEKDFVISIETTVRTKIVVPSNRSL